MNRKNTDTKKLLLASKIQRNLAQLLHKEAFDQHLKLMTIQLVELNHDVSHAKIFYTLLDQNQKNNVAASLKAQTYHLRKLLFQRTRLHTMPMLHFIYDQSLENANRITQLLMASS